MNPHQLFIFVAAMLGHFVGDYLFQTSWMALNKSKPGWIGHFSCSVHVFCYTLAIYLFTGWSPSSYVQTDKLYWLFLLSIAVPHWLIDRRGFAWDLLKWKNGSVAEPGQHFNVDDLAQLQERIWTAPVYIMNDNTLHWVCLWLSVLFLVK